MASSAMAACLRLAAGVFMRGHQAIAVPCRLTAKTRDVLLARGATSMREGPVTPPGMAELQDFCLGRCDPARAAQIESFLADGPDCDAILAATPDDALVRHLRGGGTLT